MNDDVLNMSLRKFLKKVGDPQREIENAVKGRSPADASRATRSSRRRCG